MDGGGLSEGPQLAGLRYRRLEASGGFPFSVPTNSGLSELGFRTPVTLLVGEHGTGKSTFLEPLAIVARLPAVGAPRLEGDSTLAGQRRLAGWLRRLTWRGRTHRGFFLRAEDFFGFQKELARARVEHQREVARIDVEMADAPAFVRGMAKGPHMPSISAKGMMPVIRSMDRASCPAPQ